MNTNITYLATQEHINDLCRAAQQHDRLRQAQAQDPPGEAQHDRHHVAVRRVAVIRPAGSHFKLMPIQAVLDARRRLDATGR